MSSYKNFLIILAVTTSLFNSIISYSQTSEIRNHIFIGARPMGMGETFVAVADDGNTIYWNPAGLPYLDRYELHSMYANLFHTDVKNSYISFTVPYSERLTFGLDWLNLSFGDDELDFSRNIFNFSLGTKIFKGFSIGTNIKHLITNASLDGYSEGKASGWGADFGLLFSPGTFLPLLNGLKFGMMVHDFTGTKVRYDNGVSETLLPKNVRYGLSYNFDKLLFFEHPLLAIDIDDRFHFGTEFWLPSLLNVQLGLRTGLQKDIYVHGEKNLTFSFGTSINYQIKDQYILNFDYSYTDSPSLFNTSRFSLGISFSLPLSPVKIDTVFIKDIYASLYPFHAETSCGLLKCSYHDSKKLDVRVKLDQPYYEISSEEKIVLNPEMQPQDTLKEIDLIPTFSEKILQARGEDKVFANILIEPRTIMRTKPEKLKSNNFIIYGIGKINWANGEDQIGAFITPEDPVIRDLALQIINQNQYSPLVINEVISHADHIFTNLGDRGINYVGDIESTYGKKPIDTIYYPRELLAKRMGDCDDTTVLLASLFQSIGIPTALVSVEGHIFIMFDSGINKIRQLKMCLPSKMYHIWEDNVWIPIETTWIGKTFIEAWEKGANILNDYQKTEEFNIFSVNDAWQKYKPIPIRTLESIISKPEVLSILNHQDIQQNKKTVADRQEEHIKKMEEKVSQYPDSIEIRNELATTYAMSGRYNEAKEHYFKILHHDSTYFNALNNLANVYFFEGTLDSAQIYYVRALSKSRTTKDSNGVYLNLGSLYAAVDSTELTYEMYANVVRDVSDTSKIDVLLITRVESLLGLNFDKIDITKADEKKKLKKVSSKKVKKLVAETISKKVKPKGKKVSTTITRKQRKPKEEIEDIFYWAY